MASKELKKAMDDLLRKKNRRIVTGTVRSGRRTEIITVGKQGKYIRYRTPKSGDASDLALLPTITSAIINSRGGKIRVKKSDYKEKVRRRKISTLICLVLDTSSSMVMDAKMRGIKDSLNGLMLDIYQKRDRISLVVCFGRSAEVVLPFTSSVEKGNQFIEQLKFGGTTPLAAGMRRGMENLLTKTRIEKDTNSLLIIVTDGSANTPLVPGVDVDNEVKETAANILKHNIPVLVIDVNIKGSEMAEEIARLCDGKYFKIDHSEVLGSTTSIDDVMKFDRVMEHVTLALVDPNMKGILFKAQDRNMVSDVLTYLDTLAIEFKAVSGCHSGCDPDDPEAFCHHCKLKYVDQEEPPEMNTSLRTYPIVSLSSFGTADELIGDIFVRFLATPSYLHKVNRGILFIKDIDTLSKEVVDILVETLKTRNYTLEKDGMSMTFPTKFSIIGTLSNDEASVPKELEGQMTMVIDTEPEKNLEYNTKFIQYEKEFDADPAGFENKLDRGRKESIMEIIKARKMLRGVSTPDILNMALDIYSQDLSKEDCFPSKLKAMAKVMAAKKMKSEVTEIEAVEAIEILRRQKRLKPGTIEISPNLTPFIEISERVAEAEIIRDKLMSTLVAKDEIGGVMIRGFNADAVRTALRSLQDMSLHLMVPKGCKYECDPNRSEEFCPECRLKYHDDRLEIEEQPMPVVFLPPEVGLKQLKGEIFVKYVVSPNLLSRAHRGIVFIEDIDLLKPDIADAMAQVMSTKTNIVERGSVLIENPCRTLVIGTISDPDAEVHPVIIDHMTAMLEASDHDRTMIKLKSLGYLEEFGSNPEMFSKQILADIDRATSSVIEGQELFNEVSILDSQLDLIVRICNEFDVEGNSTEFNVEKVAKTLAAIRGSKKVDDMDIINASKMVLPLAALTSQEMQDYISRSLKDMVLQYA